MSVLVIGPNNNSSSIFEIVGVTTGLPGTLSVTGSVVADSGTNTVLRGYPILAGSRQGEDVMLTNVLALRGQSRELSEFVKYMVATELGKGAAIEIELLEAFKLKRLSMHDIETSLRARQA